MTVELVSKGDKCTNSANEGIINVQKLFQGKFVLPSRQYAPLFPSHSFITTVVHREVDAPTSISATAAVHVAAAAVG